jgi:hypothetical protein
LRKTRNSPFDDFADGIFFGDVVPRVGFCVFERERNFSSVGVDFYDGCCNFVADRQNIRGLANAFPRKLGYVNQAVNAASQVDERAEIRKAAYLAFYPCAHLQLRKHFLALLL